jgi:hypothetical protein
MGICELSNLDAESCAPPVIEIMISVQQRHSGLRHDYTAAVGR